MKKPLLTGPTLLRDAIASALRVSEAFMGGIATVYRVNNEAELGLSRRK